MLARITSGAVMGVDAYLVTVEVDSSVGLPYFDIVGLPDAAIRESKVRILTAIRGAGIKRPQKRISINLAPADIKKEGAAFDLPVALGILVADGSLDQRRLRSYLVAGELSLTGEVRPVRGVLPMALAAREAGLKGVMVPAANAREAAAVVGLEVIPVRSLAGALEFLNGRPVLMPRPVDTDGLFDARGDYPVDLGEVKGQSHAKRALEVAAAGGHNLLMIGPPGSGKSMLARRLPTILPDFTFDEALETTRIYSVVGINGNGSALVTRRPFRDPHHTISDAGLIGGGRGMPRPGEVSLAHNGVLFLDELPEFRRNVLEALRQPLEARQVTITRARCPLVFPADIMLVAAMNPCHCGYNGDGRTPCLCTPEAVMRYRNRISGPLLDRIDIHIEVPRVPYRELANGNGGESSVKVRERVNRARRAQIERLAGDGGDSAAPCNARMSPSQVRRHCRLEPGAGDLLETAVEELGLSARAHDRVLKVARTIADLDGATCIASEHLAEAIQYRCLDRQLGGVVS